MSKKIIAVHGATGTQGGSVVKALRGCTDWTVRAITRNTTSASAVALASEGAEVVSADFDDEASLLKAYEGVSAIFLVTNFWEHIYSGSTAVESGKKEAAQALTVIKIADKLPWLEHFIWSTLPGNAEGQAKRIVVEHFDDKAEVDVIIKKEYPKLAAKTTFLYVGYYINNLANFPSVKLFQTPASFGTYVWLQPVKSSAVLPSAGDTSHNVGIFVRASLNQPEKTLGKYVGAVVDYPTHAEVLKLWSEATGKKAAFLQVDADDWNNLLGEPGKELYLNLKAFEDNPRWAFDNDPLTGKDLGIENELLSTKDTLIKLKDSLI
jgi:hypothetical protein